jgi:hypothetical protein
MRYLRLFEDNSGSKLELIKNIIKENQFLSKYAEDIVEDSIKEFNDYIYVKLPDELNSPHINKHFDKNSPGSIWSISKEEVSKLILDTLNNKPTKEVQEGPTFKYKWLNLEYAKPIGFDSLKKVEGEIKKVEDLEPFGMTDRVKEWDKVDAVAKQNGYNLVTKEGEVYNEEDLKNNVPCFIKQEIGVVDGDKMQNPTKVYNLITAKVGEVDGKAVLTLMTVFPGVNPVDKDGKDITNKKDLAAAGYALIKSEKTNESINKNKLKYLKTFESFSINENLEIIDHDDQLEEDEKNRIKQTFPYGSIDSENYELFGMSSEEEFNQSIEYGEIDTMRIQSAVTSAIEDMFPNYEVICSVYHGDEKLSVSITREDTDSPAQFNLNIEI